jgi:hypothetical protein
VLSSTGTSGLKCFKLDGKTFGRRELVSEIEIFSFAGKGNVYCYGILHLSFLKSFAQ